MTIPHPPFTLLWGPQAFQVFVDDQESQVRPAIIHGHWGECYERLMALNDLGAGIFHTVNATDGLGRSAANITEIRAWYTDIDGAHDERHKRGVIRRLLEHPLPPSCIVESRNGVHAYWYAVPGLAVDLDAYRTTEEGIIGYWGGDPSVKDVARVLRTPLFAHRKRKAGQPEPTLHVTRVAFEQPEAFYTQAELQRAFPPPVRVHRTDHDRSAVVPDSADDWGKITLALHDWRAVPMARHRVMTLACGVAIKFGVGEARCVSDLLPIVERWDTGRDMGVELKRTARWAYQRGDTATVKALRNEGVPVPALSRPSS
jgi:hypothetical protein